MLARGYACYLGVTRAATPRSTRAWFLPVTPRPETRPRATASGCLYRLSRRGVRVEGCRLGPSAPSGRFAASSPPQDYPRRPRRGRRRYCQFESQLQSTMDDADSGVLLALPGAHTTPGPPLLHAARGYAAPQPCGWPHPLLHEVALGVAVSLLTSPLTTRLRCAARSPGLQYGRALRRRQRQRRLRRRV